MKLAAHTRARGVVVSLIALGVLALDVSASAASGRSRGGRTGKAAQTTTVDRDASAKRDYEKARETYRALAASPAKRRLRQPWTTAIAGFERVVSRYGTSDYAARAAFMCGELWSELHRVTARGGDLDRAVQSYLRVAEDHAGSTLADDALLLAATLVVERGGDRDVAERALARLVRRYPQGDMVVAARALAQKQGWTLARADDGTSSPHETGMAPRITRESPLVVIDPGHGGKDAGASRRGGVHEKDVALELAKLTATALRARGVEVVLTREGDELVPLAERTALANRLGAALFVSLHTNAARSKSAHGIETYYLDTTDDRFALRLAVRENRESEVAATDVQLALASLATRLGTESSADVAREVQAALVRAARGVRRDARDLGVKPSLFYVLLGARMPAVLVEAGFLSHPAEGRLLASASYQQRLARALAQSIAARVLPPQVAQR